MLPQRGGHTQSSPAIRVQRRRLSGPCAFFIIDFILEEAFMRTWLQNAWSNGGSEVLQGSVKFAASAIVALSAAAGAFGSQTSEAGGEANLKLPDRKSTRLN